MEEEYYQDLVYYSEGEEIPEEEYLMATDPLDERRIYWFRRPTINQKAADLQYFRPPLAFPRTQHGRPGHVAIVPNEVLDVILGSMPKDTKTKKTLRLINRKCFGLCNAISFWADKSDKFLTVFPLATYYCLRVDNGLARSAFYFGLPPAAKRSDTGAFTEAIKKAYVPKRVLSIAFDIDRIVSATAFILQLVVETKDALYFIDLDRLLIRDVEPLMETYSAYANWSTYYWWTIDPAPKDDEYAHLKIVLTYIP